MIHPLLNPKCKHTLSVNNFLQVKSKLALKLSQELSFLHFFFQEFELQETVPTSSCSLPGDPPVLSSKQYLFFVCVLLINNVAALIAEGKREKKSYHLGIKWGILRHTKECLNLMGGFLYRHGHYFPRKHVCKLLSKLTLILHRYKF